MPREMESSGWSFLLLLVHETEDVDSRGPDVVENVDEIRLGGEALEKLLVHHQECMPVCDEVVHGDHPLGEEGESGEEALLPDRNLILAFHLYIFE